MQRIYLENLTLSNDTLKIADVGLINQFLKVLRLRVGDKLVFFNSKDEFDFIFEIAVIDRGEIFLKKIDTIKNTSEIKFNLNLYQALPNRQEKIEYILQKGVEVGYTNFFFYKSKRSQKLILTENKKERLKKIVIEAVEQAGRAKIPEIIFLEKLEFNDIKNSENIVFDTSNTGAINFKDLELVHKDINVFIGPEGGFSEEEMGTFLKNNFKKVFLGNRILRTETAGIVTGFYITQSK